MRQLRQNPMPNVDVSYFQLGLLSAASVLLLRDVSDHHFSPNQGSLYCIIQRLFFNFFFFKLRGLNVRGTTITGNRWDCCEINFSKWTGTTTHVGFNSVLPLSRAVSRCKGCL